MSSATAATAVTAATEAKAKAATEAKAADKPPLQKLEKDNIIIFF